MGWRFQTARPWPASRQRLIGKSQAGHYSRNSLTNSVTLMFSKRNSEKDGHLFKDPLREERRIRREKWSSKQIFVVPMYGFFLATSAKNRRWQRISSIMC